MYRHSGEPDIDNVDDNHNPWYERLEGRELSEEEIIEDKGEHSITHLCVYGNSPDLQVIAPNVTHLRLSFIEDPSVLYTYVDVVCNVFKLI